MESLMHCYFHESEPASRVCAKCRKSICEACFHTEYPDYCWSCGLDYDNSLGEREESMELPRIFLTPAARYAIRKLAAAGGSWMGVTILGSFVVGLVFHGGLTMAAWLFSYFSIAVIYTYGLACAIVVDLVHRFAIGIPNRARAVIYASLGIAFPGVMYLLDSRPGLLNHPLNMLIGGCAAVLFWYIEQWKDREQTQFVMALFTLCGPLIHLILEIARYARDLR